MKAKVTIENGRTKVVLKPENDFEIYVLEKVYDSKKNYEIETTVNANYKFGSWQDHELEINLVKKQ